MTVAEDGSLGLEVEGWGDRCRPLPTDRWTAATRARRRGCSWASSPDGPASRSRSPATIRSPGGRCGRVTESLTRMGARFDDDDGRLPVTVHGGAMKPRVIRLKMASAQVKTAIHAGRHARGRLHGGPRAGPQPRSHGTDASRVRRACGREPRPPLLPRRGREHAPKRPTSRCRATFGGVLVGRRRHRANERRPCRGRLAQPDTHRVRARARTHGPFRRGGADRRRRLRAGGLGSASLGGPSRQ